MVVGGGFDQNIPIIYNPISSSLSRSFSILPFSPSTFHLKKKKEEKKERRKRREAEHELKMSATCTRSSAPSMLGKPSLNWTTTTPSPMPNAKSRKISENGRWAGGWWWAVEETKIFLSIYLSFLLLFLTPSLYYPPSSPSTFHFQKMNRKREKEKRERSRR